MTVIKDYVDTDYGTIQYLMTIVFLQGLGLTL